MCDAGSVDAVVQALSSLTLSSSGSENSTANSTSTNIPPYLLLSDAETAEKLRLVSNLPVVAQAMGTSKLKDVLLPKIDGVIQMAIDNGDDELVLEICKQLGKFGPFLGSSTNLTCLVPLLGRVLTSVEEVVVTEGAVDAFLKIIPDMPTSIVESHMFPLIKSVFEGSDDLYCSSRRAAVRLIVPVFAKTNCTDMRNELRSRLLNACVFEDEIQLVREAAVLQLGDLAQYAVKERHDLLGSLVTLSNDNHRDIRAASVSSLLTVSKFATDKDLESMVFPVLEKYLEDPHRNTRQNFGERIGEYQALFNKITKNLGPLFIRLWEDNEPEVRRATAKNLTSLADSCPKDFFNSQLIPKLKEHLTNEHDDRVKKEIISETVRLLPKMKKEDGADIVKTVLNLINDNSSALAKQSVFDHLKNILTVVSAQDLKTNIIPSLLKLYGDKNWRVRLGIVKNIPELLHALDEVQISSTLIPAFLSWLKDPAYEIRMCATEAIGRAVKDHKGLTDGIAKNTTLAALVTDSNYQFRKIWILAATELMDHGSSSCISILLPQLMKLAGDKIPNVRMAVVKSLIRLAPRFDASVIKKDIISPLTELTKDDDADVKYYAEEAMSKPTFSKYAKDAKPVNMRARKDSNSDIKNQPASGKTSSTNSSGLNSSGNSDKSTKSGGKQSSSSKELSSKK